MEMHHDDQNFADDVTFFLKYWWYVHEATLFYCVAERSQLEGHRNKTIVNPRPFQQSDRFTFAEVFSEQIDPSIKTSLDKDGPLTSFQDIYGGIYVLSKLKRIA